MTVAKTTTKKKLFKMLLIQAGKVCKGSKKEKLQNYFKGLYKRIGSICFVSIIEKAGNNKSCCSILCFSTQ